MQLPVQPDGVAIAIDDPLHVGHLRPAVIGGGNQFPSALPFFCVVRRIRRGNGFAACEQTNQKAPAVPIA
jgi:hypothetical protein